jgi:hypothetical protein
VAERAAKSAADVYTMFYNPWVIVISPSLHAKELGIETTHDPTIYLSWKIATSATATGERSSVLPDVPTGTLPVTVQRFAEELNKT